ncbi:NAD(P)/FAD-dependent oxidoreductase [Cellulomonas sp. Leaf334]|uniref:type III sulfide quinone reductase, selenoprotein subtype n=1 Tax=Cellulomonas sp. Leaf334 TaxID=1736339 RepID=UPI0006FEAF2E|nr:FAD/NAD(P)-binding oxidoreductase [Cellulomonas sp. Leaf334]KQR16082.1 oxidoreductase [Cellulomonas sp. Leaf334]
MTRHVVVLGGGTAGTMVANKLRRRLDDTWAITVVDRDDAHAYQPGFLFVPFGGPTTSLVRSRHAFVRDGVELVLEAVDRIDVDAREVVLLDGRLLPYDYLVIASGASTRPDQTPGMLGPQWRRTIFDFYTLDGAKALATALRRFQGGRLVVHVTDVPITCPVAPLEFTFLADDWLRERGRREATDLIFVTPLDGAFTQPIASQRLGSMLVDRGITVEPDFLVERIDGTTLESYDGRRIPFDLLVTVPLHRGADFVERSGLGDELGFVPVDRHTLQSTADPRIFAIGDASDIPTSKAGSVAHFSADVLVDNLVDLTSGRELTHSFDGHATCFVESGDGKALLLDFNYDTEPLPGTYPVPFVGPLRLLMESRANHLGKLAFRWLYWNVLLPGRPMPIAPAMSMAGKKSPVPTS